MSEEKQEVNFVIKTSSSVLLLDLPDDILLIVFKYLDPRDLLNLSRSSSERLNALARYRTLWSKVDLRNHYMMLCQLKEFAEYLLPTTKFIASRGCVRFVTESIQHSQNCSSDALKVIIENCPNLETLIFEEHYFDGTQISVRDFPSSLKRLTLKDCEVENGHFSRFLDFRDHMSYLEVLILDGCEWVTPKCLLYINQLPNLKELSMRSCTNLKNYFHDIALAASVGFKSLKTLDIRDTFVSGVEFCAWSCIASLTHLLVDYPCSSNVNITDSLKNSEDANGEGTRQFQLPAGVRCYCTGAEPQVASNLSGGHVIFHTVQWSVQNTVYYDPECFDRMKHICDWSVMRLGIDFEDLMEVAFFHEFNPTTFDRFKHHLTNLVIKNCKGVTDNSLQYLSRMNSLKYLNVKGTSITPHGISSFLTRRPDIKLENDYDIN